MQILVPWEVSVCHGGLYAAPERDWDFFFFKSVRVEVFEGSHGAQPLVSEEFDA